MQKLAESANITIQRLESYSKINKITPISRDNHHTLDPTRCLLLKNMFTASEINTPNVEKEIIDDVREEVNLFGRLAHIYVDRDSEGHVYIKLDSIENSVKVNNNFFGRIFGGRKITSEYVTEKD